MSKGKGSGYKMSAGAVDLDGSGMNYTQASKDGKEQAGGETYKENASGKMEENK